jgi:hypothetical protein
MPSLENSPGIASVVARATQSRIWRPHAAEGSPQAGCLIHSLVANWSHPGRTPRPPQLAAPKCWGQHAGEWQVDFTVNPPACRGTGTLEKAPWSVADAMMRRITHRRASNIAPPRSRTKADLLSTLTPASRLRSRCLPAAPPRGGQSASSQPVHRQLLCVPGSSDQPHRADSRRHLPIKRHRVLEQGPRYQTGA